MLFLLSTETAKTMKRFTNMEGFKVPDLSEQLVFSLQSASVANDSL